MDVNCRACGESELEVFYRARAVPVHASVLCPDQESARAYPRGELVLALCRRCGFIQNTAFDPSRLDYSHDYEESQAYSPQFRAFIDDLACDLISRHQLRGKRVLEIGSGKGDFLVRLCELGDCTGLGFDPGHVPGRVERKGVAFRQENYGRHTPDVTGDLVVCRHTLEHIAPVYDFVLDLGQAVARTQGSVLYLEVPETLRILRQGAFWDLYYEHCSYFTAGSLGRVLERAGFGLVSTTIGFDDQYLLTEAILGSGDFPPPDDLSQILAAVASFSSAWDQLRLRWQRRLESAKRPVVWAATSKTVAFLGAMGKAAARIEAAVDINPHKHGSFLPGSGVPIIAPESLAEHRPDLVIAMNPVYLSEIGHDLKRLGISAQLQPL